MNVMVGTMTPEQMAQQRMLAEVLRAPQEQRSAAFSAPTMQMQAMNPMGGVDISGVGQGLGNAMLPALRNVGTAMKYDTTPFSQQTDMLAAQDASF